MYAEGTKVVSRDKAQVGGTIVLINPEGGPRPYWVRWREGNPPDWCSARQFKIVNTDKIPG